jgi:hypothetical protein
VVENWTGEAGGSLEVTYTTSWQNQRVEPNFFQEGHFGAKLGKPFIKGSDVTLNHNNLFVGI